MADIVTLSSIIYRGVDHIQSKCSALGVHFPTLDDTFIPVENKVRQDVLKESLEVIAAAHQLIATLMVPSGYAGSVVSHVHASAAMNAAMTGNVVEILREAGSQGMHAEQISVKNGMDGKKLARLLRLLSTYHIFKEISPDVFTNNRISASLDTCKALDSIIENPEEKYTATSGSGALVALVGDSITCASALEDTLFDPRTSHSESPAHAAFNRAFGTDLPFYQWIHRPENVARMKRFDAAMTGTNLVGNQSGIISGFEWNELPEGSVVVDVGGGVGTSTMVLYNEYKHLKYVVQDTGLVIEDAKLVWATHRPQAIANEHVILQGFSYFYEKVIARSPPRLLIVHDFFAEQPVENARVFFLRFITHNWPTQLAAQILRRLRDAATQETTLILVDVIVQYACRNVNDKESSAETSPLLPNYGIASAYQYILDSYMLLYFNAQERTVQHFEDLLGRAGWKLDRVHFALGETFARIIAIPV